MAVWLVPDNPEPADALFASALAMTAGLALAPLLAGLRDPRAFLRGEHLLALAPVYWLLLDPLQGAYEFDGIASAEVRTAIIGIGLFVVAVWAGALQRPWKAPAAVVRAASTELSANAYFRVTVFAFMLGMLTFAIPSDFNVPEMIRYLGQPRWANPWNRGQLGGWNAFLDHLQYFGYLLPALTVIVARRAGWWDPRSLLSVAMSLVMSLFLAQGGGRRIIGVIFGMALVLWILTQTVVKARQVVTLALAAGLLLAALQVMLAYRSVGLGVAFAERGVAVQKVRYLHVDDNLYRFCQIIQLIPQTHAFVHHRYVIWVLVRPIPRVLWPGKPTDPGFDLSAALGREGVSYACSAIGEFYMSAGLLGIALGGWLYGRLSGVATGLLTQKATFGSYVVYSALMMSLFAGVRSMLELVLISYVVLAWVGLSSLATRLGGRQRVAPARSVVT